MQKKKHHKKLANDNDPLILAYPQAWSGNWSIGVYTKLANHNKILLKANKVWWPGGGQLIRVITNEPFACLITPFPKRWELLNKISRYQLCHWLKSLKNVGNSFDNLSNAIKISHCYSIWLNKLLHIAFAPTNFHKFLNNHMVTWFNNVVTKWPDAFL